MNKEILEFLFVGPLFSVFKIGQEIRKDIMGLREELVSFGNRLDSITGELRSDFQRLNDKLSNIPVPDDVSDVVASLNEKLTALEALDQPNPDAPATDEPVADEPVSEEPQEVSDEPVSEDVPPENV